MAAGEAGGRLALAGSDRRARSMHEVGAAAPPRGMRPGGMGGNSSTWRRRRHSSSSIFSGVAAEALLLEVGQGQAPALN